MSLHLRHTSAYVSRHTWAYVHIQQNTSAYVSILRDESPGLARKHFPLLCQHLYFCTVEASELNLNVFFVNPSAWVTVFSPPFGWQISERMWCEIRFWAAVQALRYESVGKDGDSLLNRYLISADIRRFMSYEVGYKGHACPQNCSKFSFLSPPPVTFFPPLRLF